MAYNDYFYQYYISETLVLGQFALPTSADTKLAVNFTNTPQDYLPPTRPSRSQVLQGRVSPKGFNVKEKRIQIMITPYFCIMIVQDDTSHKSSLTADKERLFCSV